MPRKQYEYRHITFEGGNGPEDGRFIRSLNKLGAEGWMLVSPIGETSRYGGGQYLPC